MDTSSWRSTQSLGEAVGGYSIKCGDWRSQLQEHARQRIVNKMCVFMSFSQIPTCLKLYLNHHDVTCWNFVANSVCMVLYTLIIHRMYTLKSNPFFGYEGFHKLKNRAVGFEEKVYTAATSQTDYLQKISSMVLNLEPRLQNPMPDAMQSNSGAKTVNPSHPDSTAQTGNANSVSGGQQQLLGIQSGNSGMQTDQHSVHILPSKIPVQQQNQQSSGNLPTQVQQSQPHLQQQVMPHMQSQSGQLQQQQQQVGVQQQPNLPQQRLPTSAGFQQKNVFDQQKQLSQQQRSMPEASSNHTSQSENANDGHQQEEVYQKIKAMKDLYLLELNELNHKFFGKLQQSGGGTVCDSSMDTGDWRAQLEAGLRQGLVNMITDTLRRHLPFTRHGDLQQVKNMAVRYEDIIYTAAASQIDYLRELFTMMMIMETPMQLKAGANGVNPSDPGGKGVVGDCSMVYDDWRAKMQADSRKRIVNIILDTMKTHLLSSRDEELKQISMRFEEKTYDAATSQSEYLHNISLMMLALQIRSQNPMPDAMGADSINPSVPGGSGAIGNSFMESGDWRSQLQADSRQKMVNRIMETMKRHLPFSGHEGLHEHKKIAMGFEENFYTAATSLSDYLRKISIKLLVMKARSRNYGANSVNPSDPGDAGSEQARATTSYSRPL